MLNQPSSCPARQDRSEERIRTSNLRKRADDAELQSELKRINNEMELNYD